MREYAPDEVLICLCANKIDLRKEFGGLTRYQGQIASEQLGCDYFFEVSAKENTGLDLMIE